MFTELVESVVRPRDKRKKWAVAVSLALQAICLLILIVVPLIYTQALPKAIVNTALVALPGAAPKPAVGAPPKGVARSARFFRNGAMIAPGHIPLHVNIIEEPPLPPEASMGDAISSGNSGLNLLDVAANAEEKVSRPAGPASEPRRVLVTSTMEAAKLISQIQPVYPPLAIQARIQGNVVLHAIIAKEGGVSELQVLSGHPLLVNAALAAVRQWRYSPTLLNGQAVEVETTITVSFVLAQ